MPTAYPVACLPQAWAAGSIFMMLRACLGVRVDGWSDEIRVDRPRLPIGIDQLTIEHIPIGSSRIDLTFRRSGDEVLVFQE